MNNSLAADSNLLTALRQTRDSARTPKQKEPHYQRFCRQANAQQQQMPRGVRRVQALAVRLSIVRQLSTPKSTPFSHTKLF